MTTPAPSDPSFSLITFAFNEEDVLEKQIRTWVEIFRKYVSDFEIVLVNDCSTDRTGGIADALALEIPQLTVIHHTRNKGVGEAIRTARAHVTKDIVFWNDIEGHFDLDDLPKILPFIQDRSIDIVSCFKHDTLRSKELLSMLKSRVNYYLLRIIFFSNIRDFQFVQFYPRRYFQECIHLEGTASFIPPECLIKAESFGLTIRQVQLLYVSHPDRASKSMNFKTLVKSVFSIFKFWGQWYFRGGRQRAQAYWEASGGLERGR